MGKRTFRGTFMAGAVVVIASGAAALAKDQQLQAPSYPPENVPSEAKRVLGKILFFEEQLSSDNSVACATCHVMARAGTDPRRLRGSSADAVFTNATFTEGAVFASPGVVAMGRDGGYSGPTRARQVTPRTAPSPFAASYADAVLWDGAATTAFVDPVTSSMVIAKGGALESQSLRPLLNRAEMGHADRTMPQVIEKLARVAPLALADRLPADLQAALGDDPGYPELFQRAFGDAAITAPRVAFAIATYERSLVPDLTDYDRFVAGDQSALTEQEKRGLAAFRDSGCAACHAPPLFSDETFRATGVRPRADDGGVGGRTGIENDDGRFKVPSLRNVALKHSFFHDGKRTSLREAIRFYKRTPGAVRKSAALEAAGERATTGGEDTIGYGDGKPDEVQFVSNQDPAMDDIRLTNQDVVDIQAFLEGGLVDPRVQDEQFPFDRPLLASEHPELKPQLGGVAFDGGSGVPQIVVESPAVAGGEDFRVGVIGVGGRFDTYALLVASWPGVGGTFVVDELVAGGSGGATTFPPIGSAAPGDVVHLEWRVANLNADDSISQTADVPVIAPRALAVPQGGRRPRADQPTVDDRDAFVPRAAFRVDWKTPAHGAFSATVRVNPSGAGTDVSQTKLSVSLGGAALLRDAQFDADGRLHAGPTDASFDRHTGLLKISLRGIDLGAALSGTSAGGRGTLDVPFVVTVGGMGLSAPTVSTTIPFRWSGRSGGAASGQFEFVRAGSASGAFQVTRVMEAPSEGGVHLRASGVLAAPDGAPFAAPTGLTIRIGDSWRLDVEPSQIKARGGVVAASAPRDGLRSLRVDARARTFVLNVVVDDRSLLEVAPGTLVPVRFRVESSPKAGDAVVSYETVADVRLR